MNLYLVDGEDPLNRVYQTLVVLAEDELAARRIIAHEVKGFRVDHMEYARDYPQLAVRPAVIARITLPGKLVWQPSASNARATRSS